MNTQRLIPIIGSAAATTFSLFYMMQGLVATGDVNLDTEPPTRMFTYVQEPEKPKRPAK
jgi:hypothetical protein